MKKVEFDKQTKTFIAKVVINGSEIPFRLFTRPLKFGTFGTIQYYWMNAYPNRVSMNVGDGSGAAVKNSHPQFSRRFLEEDSFSNYPSILRYWFDLSYANGYHFKHEGLTPWLLALCYPIVCDDKSIQKIYNDAHFSPKFKSRMVDELSDDLREQISKVVDSKDFDRVQQFLDVSFNRENDLKESVDKYQEEFGDLMYKGKKLVLTQLNDGILNFRNEVKAFIRKIRRRSGNNCGRTFINILSYNFKFAYYGCYSAVWNALIPWIRENRGLDRSSEAFLRLWHNQNRTIIIPDGKTLADVQSVPLDFLDNDPFYEKAKKMVYEGFGNPKKDPMETRDVFNGQILALHPLSIFFMNDTGLLNIAGQFFFSQDCENAFKNGLSYECKSYTNLLKCILQASLKYKISREKERQKRQR